MIQHSKGLPQLTESRVSALLFGFEQTHIDTLCWTGFAGKTWIDNKGIGSKKYKQYKPKNHTGVALLHCLYVTLILPGLYGTAAAEDWVDGVIWSRKQKNKKLVIKT